MAAKLVVLTGPTATGKTRLGVELCLRCGGEVVSADSMQIYRGMDVGTAKATPEEMRGVPHHMLDAADPDESFSVSRYVEMASACVDDILARGRLPVIVGGTGLYIDSLIAGRGFADSPQDGALRALLCARYDEDGGEALFARLTREDPVSAARIHRNDRKRVVRALEILELTGETMARHDERTRSLPPRYDALKLALTFSERAELYRRIDARVDAMFAAGLADEVARLLDSGLRADSTAMQAIGYKEIAAALAAGLPAVSAEQDIKRESRRYAKRQLSWLRRDAALHWIAWKNSPDFEYAVQISTALMEEYGIMLP